MLAKLIRRLTPLIGFLRMFKYLLILTVLFISGCHSTYSKPDGNIVSTFSVAQGDILLVVDVTSVKYTNYTDASCPASECIVMRSWFLYEAEILDVLIGDYRAPIVKFANMQHSYYIDEVTKKWYVLLREFKSAATAEILERKYFVVQHEFSKLQE